MEIIYIPSIKKDLKTSDRDYYIIPGIDIILIDFLLDSIVSRFKNTTITYMPFKEEKEEFVNKIVGIYKNNKNFNFSYFSLQNVFKFKNGILISDILKIGILYSIRTFNPCFYYIPYLEKEAIFFDIIYIFTNFFELEQYFKNLSNIKDNLFKTIINKFNKNII